METSGNKDRAGPSSAEIRGVEQSSTFLEKQDRAELSSAPETTKETSIQNIHEGTFIDNNRVLKVPFVSHCDTSILEKTTLQDISCNVENISVETDQKTSLKGPLLGITKPSWIKAADSEMRLAWLKTMYEKKLCVRNIESYAKALSAELRTDEMKVREEERTVLLDLMLVKIRDEKRNLKILQGIREEMRCWLKMELGRRRFDTLMIRLGREVKRRKESLEKKYKAKVKHLEEERKKEKDEKEKQRAKVLEELSIIEKCLVKDKESYEKIQKGEIKDLTIGDINIDQDEINLLSMQPKFSVLKRLDEEDTERDIEIGFSKLRLEISQSELNERAKEIQFENAEGYMVDLDRSKKDEDMTRQIYHPFEKAFDYGNRRVTDIPECSEVRLPKPVDQKYESEMSIIREIIMKEFWSYKKEIEKEITDNWRDKTDKDRLKEKLRSNQEYMNLNKSERKGLFKLRKRIKDGNIIVVKTDKSGKLVLMKKEDYIKIGVKDNVDDKLLERKEARDIQKKINNHTKMICKALNAGENHGHLTRIIRSKVTKSENVAPKYYLFKDHKKGKMAFRPVVSGCSSDTLGLSNLLSDVIESVCCAIEEPYEVISSEDMLSRFELFNKWVEKEKLEKGEEYDWRKEYMLLGSDVQALFPSLSAEKTSKALRAQIV